MKERPILFSGPMVRALMAGTKTQTRQAVKRFALEWLTMQNGFNAKFVALPENNLSPYGYAGDRLWVQEAFRFPRNLDEKSPSSIGGWAEKRGYQIGARPIRFEADGTKMAEWKESNHVTPYAGKLRHSIHMPRWASRITLKVTSVRVERLQDISEADAIAEGIERAPSMGKPGAFQWCDYQVPNEPSEWFNDPVRSYWSLWDHINGPGSVEANPWVWVVEWPALLNTEGQRAP